MKSLLEQHAALLKELAELFFVALNKQEPDWIEAYIDSRSDSPDCAINRAKLRTKTTSRGFDYPLEMTQVLDQLWELRNRNPDGAWYGLLVQISRSGEVDVKYRNEPECVATFGVDMKANRPF